MVALTNFADMVKTAIEEGIDIIFAGAGLPMNLPQYLDGTHKTKIVPIVSSGKAARILCRMWMNHYQYLPDAIVVEGPKAGGHLGFKTNQIDNLEYSLENIVMDVIRETKVFEEEYQKPIPVIAAGGIYTGADIRKFMDIGVAGVQMATRFVPTAECDATEEFKNSYIEAKQEDIVIINSPVGMPGRAILNDFIRSFNAGEKIPYQCPYHCIITCDYRKSPYCIALALMNAQKGNFKNGFAFAGQNAYRSTSITSVKSVVDALKREFRG